jgi:hypothetical protein
MFEFIFYLYLKPQAMKKHLFSFVLFFACSFFSKIFAQAPVITAINGPTAVCSSPSQPMSFTATAINNPTAYAWTVSSPSPGVIIGNPTGSVTSITFPFTNATYTLYCSATNSLGTSPTVSFVVQVFETPSITFSGANSFCQGSSTNLQASATILMASPTINYFWAPGTGLNTQSGPTVTASPSVNTIYTVTATKGICSNTAAITVSVLPRPNVGANPTSASVCPGSSVVLSGTGANTYTWTGGITNGVAFTPTASGFYIVTGTGANGCTDTSGTQVTLTTCAGLKEYQLPGKDNLIVYPNPASDSFILLSSKDETVNIFNDVGQLIRRVRLSANTEEKITGLNKGIYFVISPHSRLKMIIH